MTILEEIEAANKKANITAFAFANLKELNSFLDSFNELDYPLNGVVPFTINGTFGDGPIVTQVIPLQGWVLTRLQEDTNNYRSREIESEYMEPMRKFAKDFLKNLVNSQITNPEAGDISYTLRPEYAFLSNHLFGVSYTMNWPVRKIC